jgi:energy-coupling factor transporter ATP-binding protein EcfA2
VADDPIIAFADLSVTYAGAASPALDRLDLAVRAGEYVGIVGLNGAGKTTLGLTLNGIVPQLLPGTISGRVTVAGHDPSTVPVREMARSVGIVFDNPEYQLSQPTVADEVAFGLESLGVVPDAMPSLIGAALTATGLLGLEDRSPMGLSGGQQQRLAIAAVLVMEPAILFMDEPTSNLDPAGSAEVFDLARRLNVERGMTVVVAEHDVEALATHADRIVVLSEGRVAMQGATAEVLGRVDELERLGLRVPQVTAFAHALAPDAGELPLTVPEAVRWLEART